MLSRTPIFSWLTTKKVKSPSGKQFRFPGVFSVEVWAGSREGRKVAWGFLPNVSVQRQDVALQLKLTPSINEYDMIRMEVDQEISDIAERNFGGLGPSTTKRTAKTTVITKDQQTVIIGGLMNDRVSKAQRRFRFWEIYHCSVSCSGRRTKQYRRATSSLR